MLNQGKDDLISFCILNSKEYQANWHHDLIAEKLKEIESGSFYLRGKKILILQMPPRHGKSEEVTINFPAWYLGRKEKKEAIVCSYSGDLASHFGGKTRDIIKSGIYGSIFNKTLKVDSQAKNSWELTDGSSYEGVGVGGAITGKGADLFIFDDPIKNDEEANSDVYRDKVWDFFRTVAWTRLTPDGVMIIILTRWHIDDLVGRILQSEEFKKIVEIIEFPAIAVKDESYRKKGEALWPTKYNLEKLNQIKNLIGVYNWQSLYQQNPVATESQEFRKEWFKYRSWEEINRLNTRKFLTIDTALSAKESSDYFGFCENYVDKENIWNFCAYRMHLNNNDFINYLFTIQDKRGFEQIGIEKTAYLIGLKTYLDAEMRKRGKFLPIINLEHKQKQKDIRIRGLIPRYSSGSIFHIKNECNDLEEELLTFPRGINDDTVDAAAYQNQIALNTIKKVYEQPPYEGVSDFEYKEPRGILEDLKENLDPDWELNKTQW